MTRTRGAFGYMSSASIMVVNSTKSIYTFHVECVDDNGGRENIFFGMKQNIFNAIASLNLLAARNDVNHEIF